MSFAICLLARNVVLEINLPGFGDVSDTDGANDNSIRVQLGVGERSPGHDFVDERVPGTPAPTPVGQTAVPTSGSPVGTPGPTPLGQTPFPTPGLPSSTPAPTPPGQTLAPTSGQPVTTPAPTTSILGCISGTVREDTNNDNTGDVVLSGVAITLFSDAGGFVATTRTDSWANMSFAIYLLARTSSLRSTCQGSAMFLTQMAPTTTVFVCS